MNSIIGNVHRVVGPVIEAEGVHDAQMLELVQVGESHLVGEIMRLQGQRAYIQVYEDTTGLAPGAPVYGTGMPLSVHLGPGLIGTIYDGIQRPLESIKKFHTHFIEKGLQVPPLDMKKKWEFKPCLQKDHTITGGEIIGTVQETQLIEHKILAHPHLAGTIQWIAPQGEYTLQDTIATLKNNAGKEENITLAHKWPVRHGRPFSSKLPPSIPLVTGQRVIDTLFPIAKGGTIAVPGGFGTGKTMIQHALAKWSDADIIVFIGCGERGNEMTEVLSEFPKLIDPKSGRPIMERTILIANTSNMPVAAREACIYTGITLAEYYRDMGYHVALMADSTSRWAEALRELSGRMEEMPADEGFPAYLPARLAEFYERAGVVKSLSGHEGSVTTIGSVSPPGGDFSEPVTQHTKRYIRCFWALDRQLANARHYPAISWIDSYSEYLRDIAPWWKETVDPQWSYYREKMMNLLQKEHKLAQVVKLVGPDVLPDSQRLILEVCTLFKNAFLQQNAFDKNDMFTTAEKQFWMLKIIVSIYDKGIKAIKEGATLLKIRRLAVLEEVTRMKFNIANDECDKLDQLYAKVVRSIEQLGGGGWKIPE